MNPLAWPVEFYRWLSELPAIALGNWRGMLAAILAGTLAGIAGFFYYRVTLPTLAGEPAFHEFQTWVASLGQGLATGQFTWSVLLGTIGGAMLGAIAIARVARFGRMQIVAVWIASIVGAAVLVPLIQIKTGGVGPVFPFPPFWINYGAFGAVAMGIMAWVIDFERFHPLRALVGGAVIPSVAGYGAFIVVGLLTGWGGPAPAMLLAATSLATLPLLFLSLYFFARAIAAPRRVGF